MTLFRQHFRAELGALLGWAAGLGLYAYFIATFYANVAKERTALEEYMKNLPPSLKVIFGNEVSLATLAGWLQVEIYSYLPLLLAIYAAIAVAGIISREIDRGTAEFLFGLPVGRIRLVLARFAAFALNVALLHFTVYAAAWAGAARIGEAFPFDASLRVVAMSYLAVLAVSALLLLTSVFIPDYSRALFTGLGISVGLYVFSMALRAAGKEALLPWLIFGRYDAAALVRTGANVVDAAVLAGYTVVLVAAAVWAFSRRDLRL